MPSLLTTLNDADGPKFGDWADPHKRQSGQVFMGDKMLKNFAVSGTDEETIVRTTIQECLDGDCSIWMQYNGDEPDSFAIIEAFNDEPLTEEELRLQPFLAGQIKLDYYKVKVVNIGDPIVREGSAKKLTLRVQDDSPPGQTANKKMNVVIPSDFANFEDQYLKDMTGDIETLTTEDVPYLLSSLTFRRCL